MKKNWPYWIFILFPFALNAQTEVFWGINLHPNYSNSRLISQGFLSDSTLAAIDAGETGRLSYHGGVNITWQGPKVGFQIGLGFTQTGYRTIAEAIPPNEPNPENASSRRFVFINNHIEVPIELLFQQALDDKNYFVFMMGTSFRYNLSNSIKTTLSFGDTQTSNTEKDEINTFRNINSAFQSGFGWRRKLNDNLDFLIQPTFVFWLQGILEDAELNRSLFSLGIQFELLFKR